MLLTRHSGFGNCYGKLTLAETQTAKYDFDFHSVLP